VIDLRLLAALMLATPAAAQTAAPSVLLLAQALDRCMATHAVRLTRTDAADEAIYSEAQRGCQAIDADLRAAVRAQAPAAQADALFAQFDATARPNFMALLARIRSDRAARAAKD